ncbi:hypothetical protein [Streptococcus uberis]
MKTYTRFTRGMENRSAQAERAEQATARMARLTAGNTGTTTTEANMEQATPKAPNYSKLNSGEWGVRLEGNAQPGQIVNVVRKDGKVKPEKLGRLVWEGGGAQLYAIDKGDEVQI